MARTDVETLVLQMTADVRGMSRALDRMERETAKATGAVEKRFDVMQKKLTSTTEAFARDMNVIFASIGVGIVARDVTKLADAYIETGNKLAFAGVQMDRLKEKQADLADLAVGTRSEYEAIVNLFARLSRASESLDGATEDQIRRVTETVAKGLAGATQSERNSAILQLGQGLSSGNLAGDELRSIRENSRAISEAIAKEFGVTVGQLKKLGEEGKLSSSRVFKAILESSQEVDESFKKTRSTVGAAFENLRTRLIMYIGETDSANGSTLNLSRTINDLAENIDAVTEAVTVGAAAALGIFGARAAQAAIAAIATGAAARGMGQALLFLGGPVGLAVAALAAAMATLAIRTSEANKAARARKQASEDLAVTDARLADLTKQLANAEGERKKNLLEMKRQVLEQEAAEAQLTGTLLQQWEARLKLRREELLSTRAPVGRAQEIYAADLANVQSDQEIIEQKKRELKERWRMIGERVDALQREISGQAKPATTTNAPTTGGGERGKTAAELAAEEAQRIEENFNRAEEAAADAARALAQAANDAKKTRQELKQEATGFIDRIPNSTRAAREELARLRDLIDQGVFSGLNADNEAGLAQVEVLKEMAYRAADATEALAELAKVDDLTADQARQAADDIKRAAREARAGRDEELGRLFREQEIRDDVKSALYEAMKTGQYAEVFRERMADALDRASQRALDKFVDVIFDTIGGIGKGGLGSIFGSKSAKGGATGIFDTFFSAIMSSFFGGGRATGGPIDPGKFYVTGEKGPELIVPRSQGHVIPNSILSAMSGAPRNTTLTTRSELNIAYTIDLAGANGDQAIALIARREAQRGIAEAMKVVDKQAPSRQQRYAKLGT